MKKLLFTLLAFIVLACNTQNEPVKVTCVEYHPITEKVLVSSNTQKVGPNHKGVGTGVGAGLGYLLIGGPVGLLVGGATGYATSSDGTETINTYKSITTPMWKVSLSNGSWLYTQDSLAYKVGQVVVENHY